MKRKGVDDLSRHFYYVCLCLVGAFLISYGLLSYFGIQITELNPYPCVLYTFLGWYCPGCGGTRAVVLLMKGQFLNSFLYHPVVPYTAVLFTAYIVSHSLNIISRGKIFAMKFRPVYLYIMIGIIILQCIVKNVCVMTMGTYPFIK